VVGSYGVGMTMRVERMPAAGETVTRGEFARGPGGKGSNQAIAAARLGADVDLLTCVGSDDFGAEARELWRRESVRADHVKSGSRPTMVGFILVESGGENRIAIAPGALEELLPSDVEAFADSIEAADVCLVSLEIPIKSAMTALAVARSVGTTTVLNPAPAVSLPDEAWPLIDYLTPNETEACILCGTDAAAPEVLLDTFWRRLPGTVVMTLGAEGALVGERGSPVRVPAVPVDRVIDTTGAGDAFSAALSVALAEGGSPRDATCFANAAGAHAVRGAEVIPSLPFRSELELEPAGA